MRIVVPQVFGWNDLLVAIREIRKLERQANPTSPVVFDFGELLGMDPALVVTLANSILRLKQAGILCEYAVTSDPVDQLFAAGLLGLFPGVDLSGYNLCWPMPVTGFASADPDIVHRIVNDLGNFLPNITDRSERLGQTIAELMENVRVHSLCPWGGFICANVNQTDHFVRIAIADFGKGIHGTLSLAPPYNSKLSNDIILYEAFKYWVTGKPGERAGSGLAYASDFVKDIGGIIRAYSGTGCIRIDSEKICLQMADPPYPGTLITFDLPTR